MFNMKEKLISNTYLVDTVKIINTDRSLYDGLMSKSKEELVHYILSKYTAEERIIRGRATNNLKLFINPYLD